MKPVSKSEAKWCAGWVIENPRIIRRGFTKWGKRWMRRARRRAAKKELRSYINK